MFETFKFTLRIMKKRPLRSLLTVLQLALGVWVVAVILSLNLQATELAGGNQPDWSQSLAKLTISKVEETDHGGWMASTSNFRISDLKRLAESEHIKWAFIYETGWEQYITVNGSAYLVATVSRTSPDYAQALDLELVEGHFFTEQDQQQGSRVMLISDVVAKQLFPGRSALGEIIKPVQYGEDDPGFEVIGVYKRTSPALEFFLPESHLLFPLSYHHHFFRVEDGLQEDEAIFGEIYIIAEPGHVYAAVAEAEVLLADRRVDDMGVRGEYFSESNHFLEQIRGITLFLGAFAFMAILISAIGILSIMLVSVVERTREIGLRQALGASKGVIVRQILNESLVFSLLGALLGLIAAFFSADPLGTVLVQEIMFSRTLDTIGGLHPRAALISLLLAVLLGQVFGLYPAVQAARQDPVRALGAE